jgi:dihydrofolate reductase
MKLIAAVDKNWGIGYQNKLLISIPEDMRFFRTETMGNVVVMGRKTLMGFPNGLPLDGRINIVLTKDLKFKAKGAIIVHSMEEALEEIEKYNTDKVYVIGGESIYEQFLPYADTALITYIDYKYVADKHFPDLSSSQDWKLVTEGEEQTYFNVEYYYRTYKRAISE